MSFFLKTVNPQVIFNVSKNIRNVQNLLLFDKFKCMTTIRCYAAPAKKVYVRDKDHVNIGTIGHVDHGKTTLTAAITKVLAERNLAVEKEYEEIDKAPEEIKRGITINVATIEYATDKRHYCHTDCPGHADYIKNMITGTSHMDGAILVIAATDGVMPQTTEHIILAKQIGLKDIVVFINKVDAADSEMVELVEMEVRELLTTHGFDGDNAGIVVGSALCALDEKNEDIGKKSILKLLDVIDENISTPIRALEKPFYCVMDHVYAIPGKGNVVTGVIERGKLKKGQDIEILGYGNKHRASVIGLEIFNKSLEEGQSGDNAGILLKGMKFAELKRGMVMSKPKTMKLSDRFEAQIYVLDKHEGGMSNCAIGNRRAGVIFSKTWHITSMITPTDKDVILAGEDGKVELKFYKPMVMEVGQRFTVRDSGKTSATGVISKILDSMSPIDIENLHISKKQRKKLEAEDKKNSTETEK